MQIATQAPNSQAIQQNPNVARGQVRHVGSGPFNPGTVEATLASVTPKTRELIGRLDLSHATPRELTAVTLGLFWDGAIDIENEGTLAGMGFDSGADTPFDVMETLNGHLSFFRHSTSGFDWSGSVQIYEGAMKLALGLQDMIRALHPERNIDTYA
jgi:hypothetical protein